MRKGPGLQSFEVEFRLLETARTKLTTTKPSAEMIRVNISMTIQILRCVHSLLTRKIMFFSVLRIGLGLTKELEQLSKARMDGIALLSSQVHKNNVL